MYIGIRVPCEFCHRIFSSTKALCGHKKIHKKVKTDQDWDPTDVKELPWEYRVLPYTSEQILSYLNIQNNSKNVTKIKNVSGQVLEFHGLSLKNIHAQDRWRIPCYKTGTNWRQAFTPGLNTTIQCEIIQKSIQSRSGISVLNDGCEFKKKSNETYAMVIQNRKTKKFTAYPIGQTQLAGKSNKYVCAPYIKWKKDIEIKYKELFDIELNLDKHILANVRDGSAKESLPIQDGRTTVCGAHLLNHLGEELIKYVREIKNIELTNLRINVFEIDSSIRNVLFAGNGTVNQFYYAYYAANPQIINTGKYFAREHKCRVYHRFNRYHWVPYTIYQLHHGHWHKNPTQKHKLRQIYGIIKTALPYLLVCSVQYQCLFGPLQPGTTSQITAYDGITNLFKARKFLLDNIIGKDIYSPTCVMFCFGLINILGNGFTEKEWYKSIDEIYNIPDPSNRRNLIDSIINNEYDGELNFIPTESFSVRSQQSGKYSYKRQKYFKKRKNKIDITKGEKIYHQNLLLEIISSVILQNNIIGIAVINDVLNRLTFTHRLGLVSPILFLLLSGKKYYHCSDEDIWHIINDVLKLFIESVPSWLKKWKLLVTVGGWKTQSDLDKDRWWLEQVPFTTDMVESLNEVFNIAQAMHSLRNHWDVANQTTYKLLLEKTPSHDKENLITHCNHLNQQSVLRDLKQLHQNLYKTMVEVYKEKAKETATKFDNSYISDYKHTMSFIKEFIHHDNERIKLSKIWQIKRHIEFCVYNIYGGILSADDHKEIKRCLKRKINRKQNFTIDEHMEHLQILVDMFDDKYIPGNDDFADNIEDE